MAVNDAASEYCATVFRKGRWLRALEGQLCVTYNAVSEAWGIHYVE